MNLHKYLFGLLLVLTGVTASAQDASTLPQPLSPQEIDDFGIRVSDVRSAELPGYRKIERMLISGSSPEFEAMLRSVFPEIEFSFVGGDGSDSTGPYDAVAGGGRGVNVVADTGGAAWVHTYSAGVDWLASIDWIGERRPIVTNSSGASAPAIAEHAIAMTLSHARQLHGFRDAQLRATWDRNGGFYTDPWQVNGKTMLVLGLGAIGTQIAQKANALGMRVLAVRNSRREGPDFVEYVGLSNEMVELAAQADVVANALPLTDDTRGVIDAGFFAAMKPTAIIVNIGRGATINTDDLVAAIRSGQIAGAGLDVTDPEPLPNDHPLWGMREVIITPHVAGSGMPQETRIRLLVDNIRRYQAGEPLLNPVDIDAGY